MNGVLLFNALQQAGPYQGEEISFSLQWLRQELGKKIAALDWKMARRDVEHFLRAEDRKFVEHWSQELFQQQLEHLVFFSKI